MRSPGAGARYLTWVADHASGAIVWARPGRDAATLQAFFDELGPERRHSIRAVSIDMSAGYEKAIAASLPDAEICFDPFHLVQLAGRAVDEVRRAQYSSGFQDPYCVYKDWAMRRSHHKLATHSLLDARP